MKLTKAAGNMPVTTESERKAQRKAFLKNNNKIYYCPGCKRFFSKTIIDRNLKTYKEVHGNWVSDVNSLDGKHIIWNSPYVEDMFGCEKVVPIESYNQIQLLKMKNTKECSSHYMHLGNYGELATDKKTGVPYARIDQ